MLKPGTLAPTLTLLDAQGQPFDLTQVIGKKMVVLFFYPKDHSLGCTKQACAFRDRYAVFQDAGAQVIGISSDSVDSHQDFETQHRLPYPLLSDPKQAARKAYKVPSTLGIVPGRVTYVIDETGHIAHGFNDQLQFERHVDEALKVIERLTQNRALPSS